MSKFKNRLASIVLSTITLAGGVTTCLISDSAVQKCQAIITDEEMKKLINTTLVTTFQQTAGLPKVTAEGFKLLLEYMLLKLEKVEELLGLVDNVDLQVVSMLNSILRVIINRISKDYSTMFSEEQHVLLTEMNNPVFFACPQYTSLPKNFLANLKTLLESALAPLAEYLPDRFCERWDKVTHLNRNLRPLQLTLVELNKDSK